MRALVIVVICAGLWACGQPTREELLESQREKERYCREMLADIEAARGRPLIRAPLQENYNRECLGKTYPAEIQ